MAQPHKFSSTEREAPAEVGPVSDGGVWHGPTNEEWAARFKREDVARLRALLAEPEITPVLLQLLTLAYAVRQTIITTGSDIIHVGLLHHAEQPCAVCEALAKADT